MPLQYRGAQSRDPDFDQTQIRVGPTAKVIGWVFATGGAVVLVAGGLLAYGGNSRHDIDRIAALENRADRTDQSIMKIAEAEIQIAKDVAAMRATMDVQERDRRSTPYWQKNDTRQ